MTLRGGPSGKGTGRPQARSAVDLRHRED